MTRLKLAEGQLLGTTQVLLRLILYSAFIPALSFQAYSVTDQIIDRIQHGRSCESIIQNYINRIHRIPRSEDNPRSQLRVEINPNALNNARNLDIVANENGNKLFGPLHCVPFMVDEKIDVAGMPTTAGLQSLNDSIPQAHSDVVRRLLNAGGVLIGKASNPQTKNDLLFLGGEGEAAAVAVAGSFAAFALAADSHGSLLRSASQYGIYGFRPTWTRISTDGVFPDSHFQDTVGILTRSPLDLAKVLTLADPAAALTRKAGYLGNAILDPKAVTKMKIGVLSLLTYESFFLLDPDSSETLRYDLDRDISSLVSYSLKKFLAAGAELHNISLNSDQLARGIVNITHQWINLTACTPIWMDAYFGNKIRFPPVLAKFRSLEDLMNHPSLPAKRKSQFLINQQRRHLCPEIAERYIEAQKQLTRDTLIPLLSRYDLITYPTISEFSNLDKKTEKNQLLTYNKPPQFRNTQKVSGALLAPATGYPALTIPIGLGPPRPEAPNGVPIGLTLMAAPNKMETLISAAYSYNEIYTPPVRRKQVPSGTTVLHSSPTLTILFFLLAFLFKNK